MFILHVIAAITRLHSNTFAISDAAASSRMWDALQLRPPGHESWPGAPPGAGDQRPRSLAIGSRVTRELGTIESHWAPRRPGSPAAIAASASFRCRNTSGNERAEPDVIRQAAKCLLRHTFSGDHCQSD